MAGPERRRPYKEAAPRSPGAKELPNGAAKLALGRIMPGTVAQMLDCARTCGTNCQQLWQMTFASRLESIGELSTTLASYKGLLSNVGSLTFR